MLIWREKKKDFVAKQLKLLAYYVNNIIEICLGGSHNQFLEGIQKYVLSNFVFLFM